MAEIEVVGIQKAEFGFEQLPPGTLVSGVAGDSAVLAFVAVDQGGIYFMAFDGAKGQINIMGETDLLHLQKVDGVLLVEPADGQPPFALQHSSAAAQQSLVVTADGEVGLQVALLFNGKPQQHQADLTTGRPMGSSRRRRLSGFRLSLKVDGRAKPLFIGNF
ncbi:MAG: hypothetical protein HYU61_12045 [Brevundimonas diminuta]|nr:hypothetical protein [Brevundimonas diminuta]